MLFYRLFAGYNKAIRVFDVHQHSRDFKRHSLLKECGGPTRKCKFQLYVLCPWFIFEHPKNSFGAYWSLILQMYFTFFFLKQQHFNENTKITLCWSFLLYVYGMSVLLYFRALSQWGCRIVIGMQDEFEDERNLGGACSLFDIWPTNHSSVASLTDAWQNTDGTLKTSCQI